MKNAFFNVSKKIVMIWTQSNTCPAGFVLVNSGSDSSVVPNRIFRKYSTVHFNDQQYDTHNHTVNSSHHHNNAHTHTVYCGYANSEVYHNCNDNHGESIKAHDHQSGWAGTAVYASETTSGDTQETLIAQNAVWFPPHIDVLYCKRAMN